MLEHGEIPIDPSTGKSVHVLHRCDNPGCVNPDHLFLGSHADNMADMKSKGRLVNFRGKQHGMAKLTEAVVVRIRERVASGEAQNAIATEFRMTPTAISSIVRGRTWAHAGGPLTKDGRKLGRRHQTKYLTDAEVCDIRERVAAGELQAVLVEEYEVSRSYISNIVLGVRRAEAGGPITTDSKTRPRPNARVKPARTLSDKQVRDIRKRVEAGERRYDLAEEYGVAPGYVSRLVAGKARIEAGGPIQHQHGNIRY